MAVVGRTTTKWLNNDGLLVALRAKDLAVPVKAGAFSFPTDGDKAVVKVTLDLASLPTAASGNELIIDDGVTIPAGAFIHKVEVVVIEEPTEASGTDANLDLGLVDQDRSTEIDFNGLLAAADVWHAGTDLGVITTYDTGTTEGGALLGTQITNTGLITASADTDDWTDGTVEIRIYYTMPLTGDL